jgi:hypothetical protein
MGVHEAVVHHLTCKQRASPSADQCSAAGIYQRGCNQLIRGLSLPSIITGLEADLGNKKQISNQLI